MVKIVGKNLDEVPSRIISTILPSRIFPASLIEKTNFLHGTPKVFLWCSAPIPECILYQIICSEGVFIVQNEIILYFVFGVFDLINF